MDFQTLRVVAFDTSVSEIEGAKKYIAQHEEYKREDWKTSTDGNKDETGDENQCLNDNTTPPGLWKNCLHDKISPQGTSKKYLDDTSSPPGTSKRYPDGKICPPGTSEKYLDDTSTSPPETSKKHNFAGSKSKSKIFKIPPKIKPRKRDIKINSSDVGLTKLFQDSAHSHQKNRTFNLRNRNSRVQRKVENVKEKKEEVHFLFARETPSFIKYCKKRAKNERTTLKKKRDSELPTDFYGFEKSNLSVDQGQRRMPRFNFIDTDKIPLIKRRIRLNRKPTLPQPVARNCACKHHALRVLNSARKIGETSMFYNLFTQPKSQRKSKYDQEEGLTKDKIVEVSSSSLGPVLKNCCDASTGPSRVERSILCCRRPPSVQENSSALENVTATSESNQKLSPQHYTAKPGAAPALNKVKKKHYHIKKTKLTTNVPQGFISRFGTLITDFHSKTKLTGQRSCIEYVVFGLLIVVWSPCLLAVILAWVVMLPVKLTSTLKTDKSKRRRKKDARCEYQRMCFENYLPKNKKSFMTSATSWYTRTVGTVVNTLTSLLKLKKKAPTGAGSSFMPSSHPNPRKRYTLFYADNRGWVMKPLRRRNTRSFASTPVVQSMRCEGRPKLRCLKHLPQKFKKVCPCPVHGDDSYSRHKSSAAGDACPWQCKSPWPACGCWEKYSKGSSMIARHESRYHRRQKVNIPPTFCYPTSGIAFNSTDKTIYAKQFNSKDIANNIAHEDLANYHLGQRKNGTLPFGVVFNHRRGTKHPLITDLETFRAHKFGLAGKTLNVSKKITPRLVIKGLQGQLPKCWTKQEAGKAVNKTHGVHKITSFTGVTTSMPKHISSYRQNNKREEAVNSPSDRKHTSAIRNKKLHTLQLTFRNKSVLADISKSTGTKQPNTNTYKINYAHKTQNTSKHILCHKVTNKPEKAEKAKPDMASKCAKHTQPKQALKYKTDKKTRVPNQKHSSPAKMNTADITTSTNVDIALNCPCGEKHDQSTQANKYKPHTVPVATQKQLNTADITTSTNADIALNCPCGEKHDQSTQANKYKPHTVPVATQKQLNTADITTSTNADIALNYPCVEKHEQSTQANKYKPHKVPVSTQNQLNTEDITTSTNLNKTLNYPYGKKNKQFDQANKYKPHQVPVAIQKQYKADITTSTNVDIGLNCPGGEKHEESKHDNKHQPHQIPKATQMQSRTADHTIITNRNIDLSSPCKEKYEQYKHCLKNEPHQIPVGIQMQSRTADNTTMTNRDIVLNYPYEEKNAQSKYGYKYETHQIPNATQMLSTTADNTTMTNCDIVLNYPYEEKNVQSKQYYKYKPDHIPNATQMQSRTADNTTMTNRDIALNCPCKEKHEQHKHCFKNEPHQSPVAIQMQSRTADNTTMTNRDIILNYPYEEKNVQSKQCYKYKPDHIPVATQKQSTTADTSTITDRDIALSYLCGEKHEQSKQVYKYKPYKAINYLSAVKPSTANKEILCIPSKGDKVTICTQKTSSPEYVPKKQDIFTETQKYASKIDTYVYCDSDYERSKTKELIRPEQIVFPKKTVDCTSCGASTSCEKTGSLKQKSSLKKVTDWGWGGERGGRRKFNGPCIYKGTQTIVSLVPQENKGEVETERPKRAFTKKMVDCGCGAKPKTIAIATEFPSERQADENKFTHTQYPFKQQTLAIHCGLNTEENVNTFLRESCSTSRIILSNRTENKPTKQPFSQKPSIVGRTLQIRRFSTAQPLSTRQLQTDELLNQFQPHANSPLFGMSSNSRYGLAPQKTQVLSVQASSSQYKIARDCRCGVTPQQNAPDKQMEKITMKEKETPALKKSSETPPTTATDIQELLCDCTCECNSKSRLKSKFRQELPDPQPDISEVDKTLSKFPKSSEHLASKISQATSTLFGIASDCLCGGTPQVGQFSNPPATKTSLGTDGQPGFSQNLPSVQPDIPKVDKTLSKFPKSPEHLASKISQATSTLFGIASDCLCGVTPQVGQVSNPPATKTSLGTDGQPEFSQHFPSVQPDIPKVDKTLSKFPKSPEHLASKISQATSTLFGIASDCLCGVSPQVGQVSNPPATKISLGTDGQPEFSQHLPSVQPDIPKVDKTLSKFPKSPEYLASKISQATSTLFGIASDCLCGVTPQVGQVSNPPATKTSLGTDGQPEFSQHLASVQPDIPKVDKTLSKFPKLLEHLASKVSQATSPVFGIALNCRCGVTPQQNEPDKQMKKITMKDTETPALKKSSQTPPTTATDIQELPCDCKCECNSESRLKSASKKTNTHKTSSAKAPPSQHSKLTQVPPHTLQKQPKLLPSDCPCRTVTGSKSHAAKDTVKSLQEPTGEQSYYTKRNTTKSKFPISPDHSPPPKSLPRKCRCPVETLLPKSLPHKCRCPVDIPQDPVGEQPHGTNVSTTSSERNIIKVEKTRSKFPKSPDHSPPPKSLPRKCRCPVETLLPKSLPHKCRCPVDFPQDPVREQPYGTNVSTTSSERNIVKVDKTRSKFPKSPDISPPPKSLPRKCRCLVETLLPNSFPHKCRCPVDTLQDLVDEQPYGTKVRTTSSERNIVKVDKTRSKFPKSPDHSPPPKTLPCKCRCLVESLQDPAGEPPYYNKRSTTSSKRNIIKVDKNRSKFPKSPDHSPLPKSLPHECLCPVETLLHECPCPVDIPQDPVGEQPYGTNVSTTSSERNIVKVDKTRSKFPKSADHSPPPKSLPRKCRCLVETLQDPVGEQSYGTKVSTTWSERNIVKVDKSRSKFPKSPNHSPPPKSLSRKCRCPVETLLPKSLPHKCRCPVDTVQDPVGEQPYGTKVRTTSSERNIVKVEKTRSKFPKSPDHSPPPKSLPRKCRCPVESLQDPAGEQPYYTKRSTTSAKRNVVKVDNTRSKFPKSPDHSPPPKSLPRKCRCLTETLQNPVGEPPYGTKVSTTPSKRKSVQVDKTRSKFSQSREHSPPKKNLLHNSACPVESLQDCVGKKTSQSSQKSVFSRKSKRKSLDFPQRCPCSFSHNNIDKRCFQSDISVLQNTTRQFSIRSCLRAEGTCSVNEPSSRVQFRSKVSRLVKSLRSKLFNRKISKQTKISENPTEKPRSVIFSSLQNNPKKLNKSQTSLLRHGQLPKISQRSTFSPYIYNTSCHLRRFPNDDTEKISLHNRKSTLDDESKRSLFRRSHIMSKTSQNPSLAAHSSHSMFHNSCSCVIHQRFSKQCKKKPRYIRKPLLVDTSYSCLHVSKTSQRPSFPSRSSKRCHADNTSSLRLSKISCYSYPSYPRLSQRIRIQQSKASEHSSIVMPIECWSDETFSTPKNGMSHQILKTLFKRNSHSKSQQLPSQRNRSQFSAYFNRSKETLSEKQSILTHCLSLSHNILPGMRRCAAKHLGKTKSRQSNLSPQQLPYDQQFKRSQLSTSAQKQSSKNFYPQYSSSLNKYQTTVTAKQTVPLQQPLSPVPLKTKRSSLFNSSQSKPLVDEISSNSRKNKQEKTSSTIGAQTALIFATKCTCWPEKLEQLSNKLSHLSRKSVDKISPSETPPNLLSAQPMPPDKTSNKREKTSTLGAQTAPIIQGKCACWPEKLHQISKKISQHARKSVDKTTLSKPPPQLLSAQSTQPEKNFQQTRVGTEAQADNPQYLSIRQSKDSKQSRQHEFVQHLPSARAQPNFPKIDSLHRSSQSKLSQQPKAEQVIPIISGKCRCAGEQKIKTEYSSSNKLQPNTDLQKFPSIQSSRSPNSNSLPTDKRFPSPTASHSPRKTTLGTDGQPKLYQHLPNAQPDNSKIDSLHRSFQSKKLPEKDEKQVDATQQAETEQVIPILSGKCRCAGEQKVKTERSSNKKLQQITPSYSPNSHSLSTDTQRFQSPKVSHPTRKSTLGTYKHPELSQHVPSAPPDNSKIDSLHRSFQSKLPQQPKAEQVIPIISGKCTCAGEQKIKTEYSSSNKLQPNTDLQKLLSIQSSRSPDSHSLPTDKRFPSPTASHSPRKTTLGTDGQPKLFQHLPNAQPDNSKIDSLHRSFQSKKLTERVEKQVDAIPQQAEAEQVIPILSGKCRCAGEQKVKTERSSNNKLQQIPPSYSPNSHSLSTDTQRFHSPKVSHPTRKSTLGTYKQPELLSQHVPNAPPDNFKIDSLHHSFQSKQLSEKVEKQFDAIPQQAEADKVTLIIPGKCRCAGEQKIKPERSSNNKLQQIQPSRSPNSHRIVDYQLVDNQRFKSPTALHPTRKTTLGTDKQPEFCQHQPNQPLETPAFKLLQPYPSQRPHIPYRATLHHSQPKCKKPCKLYPSSKHGYEQEIPKSLHKVANAECPGMSHYSTEKFQKSHLISCVHPVTAKKKRLKHVIIQQRSEISQSSGNPQFQPNPEIQVYQENLQYQNLLSQIPRNLDKTTPGLLQQYSPRLGRTGSAEGGVQQPYPDFNRVSMRYPGHNSPRKQSEPILGQNRRPTTNNYTPAPRATPPPKHVCEPCYTNKANKCAPKSRYDESALRRAYKRRPLRYTPSRQQLPRVVMENKLKENRKKAAAAKRRKAQRSRKKNFFRCLRDLINQTEREAWPCKITCHPMWVNALKHRPCFWIYEMCPRMYPAFLNFYKLQKYVGQICVYILTLCFWSPLLLCGYYCCKGCSC